MGIRRIAEKADNLCRSKLPPLLRRRYFRRPIAAEPLSFVPFQL